MNNKLSIHFGEDKTKNNIFFTKNKKKKVRTLDINYDEIKMLRSSTGKADTYHYIWKSSYAMLSFNHILIMLAQHDQNVVE